MTQVPQNPREAHSPVGGNIPELRMAPDGRVAARTHRLAGGDEWAIVAGPDASWMTQPRPTAAEVESWTPLVPATPASPMDTGSLRERLEAYITGWLSAYTGSDFPALMGPIGPRLASSLVEDVFAPVRAAAASCPTPALPGRAVEQRLNQAVPLITDLVDDEDCSLDHHGYCQAHGWFDDSECPQARAKRWLTELDKLDLAEVPDGR